MSVEMGEPSNSKANVWATASSALFVKLELLIISAN